MKITFTIKESWKQLISNVASVETHRSDFPVHYYGDADLIHIQDEDFPDSHAEIILSRGEHDMKITTAWSGFTYEFYTIGKTVYCTYNGSYKGFMEQNLLPEFTVDMASAVFISSMCAHHMNTKQIFEMRNKFSNFRNEVCGASDDIGFYNHPRIIRGWVQENTAEKI